MKTQKISLETIKGKLSRTEMKNVLGGLNEAPHGGQCYLMVGTWTGGCNAAAIALYCRYGGYCY